MRLDCGALRCYHEEWGLRLVGQRGRRASVVWPQGRACDEVCIIGYLRGRGVEERGGRRQKGTQEPEAKRVRADTRETHAREAARLGPQGGWGKMPWRRTWLEAAGNVAPHGSRGVQSVLQVW